MNDISPPFKYAARNVTRHVKSTPSTQVISAVHSTKFLYKDRVVTPKYYRSIADRVCLSFAASYSSILDLDRL